MARRTYRINSGDISNLKIREEDLPAPAEGEVQVDVKAIGLNFADLYTVWGMYKAAPKEDFIPGLEYSGVIRQVGPGVEGWKEGDRVMGITRFGAYVDALNIDHRYVTALPDEWDFAQGAGYLVQVLTAYYGLIELGRLQEGYTVLIQSGAGGVGTWANRIAKKHNAFTIGTTSSPMKVSYMKEEGYDRVIVRGDDYTEKLDQAVGDRQLKLVMESIGGKVLMTSFKKMAPEGLMIVYGNASFTTQGDKPNKLKMIWKYLRRPKIDPLLLPNSNKGIIGFNLIWLYHQADRLHHILGELKKLELPATVVGERFEFEELPDAVRKLQSGTTMGKVVVELG